MLSLKEFKKEIRSNMLNIYDHSLCPSLCVEPETEKCPLSTTLSTSPLVVAVFNHSAPSRAHRAEYTGLHVH